MPYTPQTWVNDVSKLNAARMTVIEEGIEDAHTTADAAVPKSVVDAKGDLIVATAADTVTRKAVGANDEVLVAASGQSTGIIWQKIGNAQIATDAAIDISKLAGYPSSSASFLRGDGTWAAAGGSVPTGVVLPYAGASAPSSEWLICDGTAVSRTTYATLFALLSTTYGAGDGSTTFNIPDLRGRVAVGKGSHSDVNALNDNEGVAEASRSPKHRHTVTDPGHEHTIPGAGGGAGDGMNGTSGGVSTAMNPATTGISVGVAGSPLDTPAYLVVNYIIKT